MTMRNLRLDIEYEGTDYHGWQVQENARTISGTIEEILQQVLQSKREEVRLIGSGRTDAGVHALGQVANFTTDREIPEENLRRALCSLLPPDIVIRRVTEVPEDFHARRDAIQRLYRYQCIVRNSPSTLYRNLSLHIRSSLNIRGMRKAVQALTGTHDFTAFRSKHCDAKSPVRTLDSIEILEDPPFIYFDVSAPAFLRNQVRIMVSTLIEVGLGRLEPEGISSILESKDRRQAGPTLPAKGLILVEVRYPESRD